MAQTVVAPPPLVPPVLATLHAAVAHAGRTRAAALACTDLERWLEETLLEVRDSVAPSASLPEVDWLARLSSITAPPEIIHEDDDPLPDTSLSQARDIAWALALAAQHLAAECGDAVRFPALRRAANALLAIETTARRGLAATRLDILCSDRASRAIREGLLAVTFAEKLADGVASLRTIAVAAMAQSFLDHLADKSVLAVLRAEVTRDTRVVADVVTAYEALCIRRDRATDDPTLHARLVALACDEGRLSLIEGRPSSLGIEVGFDATEELTLPPSSDASGTSTLAKIPLAHVVATARQRELSATVVLTDPRGRRHAMVFHHGDLDAVHTRGDARATEIIARLAAIASLPEETEIAFFWGKDLLAGRGERTPRPAPEVLLAIARGSDRERMRAELLGLAPSLVVHANVDVLSPSDDERRLLARWNAACRGGRALDVRVLTGQLALPLAYTLVHLGEAHPKWHRCRSCSTSARGRGCRPR